MEKNGFPPNLSTEIAQNPYFGPFWAGQPDFWPGMSPSLYIQAQLIIKAPGMTFHAIKATKPIKKPCAIWKTSFGDFNVG